VTITPENGEPILIDGIDGSGLKASLPGLKLEWLESSTSAHAKRGSNSFPVSFHSRTTTASTRNGRPQPLGADVFASNDAISFALTRPLDTGGLLRQIGFEIDGIQPQATITSLTADATLNEAGLAGLKVAGTLAAGALAKGNGFEITQ